MDVSDILIFAAFGLAIVFALSYGILAPWYRAPLGWVIFLYGISMVALLFLLVWGLVFGQSIDEFWRIIVMSGLVMGLLAKIVIFYVEWHAGRSRRSRKEQPHEASR